MLIPYRRIEMTADMPVADTKKALSLNVEQKKLLRLWDGGRCPFEGHIWRNQFRIRRIVPLFQRRHYPTPVSGELRPCERGTRVIARIRPAFIMLCVMAFFASAWALTAMFTVMIESLLSFAAVVGLGAVWYAIFLHTFNVEAARAERLLHRIFQVPMDGAKDAG